VGPAPPHARYDDRWSEGQSKRCAAGGVTLVSDAASSNKLTPVLNLLAVGGGVMQFISATRDCSGKIKDGACIARLNIDYIMSLGDKRFSIVGVCMHGQCDAFQLDEHRGGVPPWVVCTPSVLGA
jgi:hypothetical protein